MRLRNKLLITIPILLIIIFVSTAVFVSFYGPKIIADQIEQNLHMKASLKSIGLEFPYRVTLTNFKIGNLFQTERISFSPSLIGFMAGKIVIGGLEIIDPVVNLEQSSDGKLNLPQLKQAGKPPKVYLTGITVKNGKFNFTDRVVDPEGLVVRLDKVNANISKVMLPPTSLKANFKFSAEVADKDVKKLGTLSGSGWFDFRAKDMDAVFTIKDLETTYFTPYYGSFLSAKKLLSAKLNLNSVLKAKDNDLDIVSELRLSNLIYAQEQASEEELLPTLNLAKNALDLFTDKQENLSLTFEIKTKMDNPQISNNKLKKIILNAAMKNLASQNPQDVMEKVTNTIKQFKEIGKEMEKIFKNKQ